MILQSIYGREGDTYLHVSLLNDFPADDSQELCSQEESDASRTNVKCVYDGDHGAKLKIGN